MPRISVASRTAELMSGPHWRMGLTAGKIALLLLTWSFVVQYGLPSDKPESSAMSNETLVSRLMSDDVIIIAVREPIEPELQEFHYNAANMSKAALELYLVDDNSTFCEEFKIWKQRDFFGNGTLLMLEGQCVDPLLYIEPILWQAFAVLFILELYILRQFKLWKQMVLMGLITVIDTSSLVSVALSRAADRTINLWVISD